jgi:hypothetical protein
VSTLADVDYEHVLGGRQYGGVVLGCTAAAWVVALASVWAVGTLPHEVQWFGFWASLCLLALSLYQRPRLAPTIRVLFARAIAAGWVLAVVTKSICPWGIDAVYWWMAIGSAVLTVVVGMSLRSLKDFAVPPGKIVSKWAIVGLFACLIVSFLAISIAIGVVWLETTATRVTLVILVWATAGLVGYANHVRYARHTIGQAVQGASTLCVLMVVVTGATLAMIVL